MAHQDKILPFPKEPPASWQDLDALDDDALGEWVDNELDRELHAEAADLAELPDSVRSRVQTVPASPRGRLLAWAALCCLALGGLLTWLWAESGASSPAGSEVPAWRQEVALETSRPTLQSPAVGSFRWSEVDGAVGYQVGLLDAQGLPVLLRRIDDSQELVLDPNHEALATAAYARVTAFLADGRSISSEVLDLD